MTEVFVCLCGTRVSQMNLGQIAASVGRVVLRRGHERASMRQQGVHDVALAMGKACDGHETGARSEVHQDGQIDDDIQWSRLLKPASMTSPLASWPLGRSESALCRLELGGASWSSEPEPEP